MAKRYYALDALRGICAMSIVIFHASNIISETKLIPHAYYAVDIFFLMSGFVIAHSYEDRLRSGMTVGGFLKARVRRLSGPFFAGACLGALALAILAHMGFITPASAAWMAVSGFALIPVFDKFFTESYGVNGPNWSLFAEFVVNLGYAACHRWLGWRYLVLIAASGLLATTLIASVNQDGAAFGWRLESFPYAPIRAVPTFAIGVILARLEKSGKLDFLPDISPIVPILAWVVLEMLPFRISPLVAPTLVSALGALTVALLIRTSHQPASFATVGAISYPLYVTHGPIITLASSTPLFGVDQVPDPIRGSMVIAIALCTAWLVHLRSDRTRTQRRLQVPSPI